MFKFTLGVISGICVGTYISPHTIAFLLEGIDKLDHLLEDRKAEGRVGTDG